MPRTMAARLLLIFVLVAAVSASSACNQASRMRGRCLSALFLAGDRTPRDVERARNYYGAAVTIYRVRCDAGSAIDCNERDKVRRLLTLVAQAQ